MNGCLCELNWVRGAPSDTARGSTARINTPHMIPKDHDTYLCTIAQQTRCLQSLCEFSSQHTNFVIYLGYKAESNLQNTCFFELKYKEKKMYFKFFTLERQFSQESNNQFVVYRRQHFKEKQKPDLKGEKKTVLH